MKKLLLLLPVLLLFFVTSCSALLEKLENLLTFNVDEQVEFTLPTEIVPNQRVSIPLADLEAEDLEKHNTSADLVKDVKLKSANIEASNPSDANLGFLKSIKIYISAEGLGETLLAYEDDIPENTGNFLELQTTDQALDGYITSETGYSLRAEVEARDRIDDPIDALANVTFSVTADL